MPICPSRLGSLLRFAPVCVLALVLAACEVGDDLSQKTLGWTHQAIRAQQIYAQTHGGKYTDERFDLIALEPELAHAGEGLVVESNSDRSAYRIRINVDDTSTGGQGFLEATQAIDSPIMTRCENLNQSVCKKGSFSIPVELTQRPDVQQQPSPAVADDQARKSPLADGAKETP